MASSSGAMGSTDPVPQPARIHEAEMAPPRGTPEAPEGQGRGRTAVVRDPEFSEASEEELIRFTKYEPINVLDGVSML